MTQHNELIFRRYGIQPELLPAHVGIIMDGNGRWAKSRHLPRLAGHRRGVERVDEVTECASRIGLRALTLFAFSNENWKRPEEEVTGLMGLLRWYLRTERRKIMNNNVRFRILGDRRKLSNDILELVTEIEEASQNHTGLNLSIALSYGSRAEIARAAARLASDVAAGKVFAADIDEKLFESYLDTDSLPPLDMVIRTSGEFRLSNFLLFQAAYAELFFETVHWPDFTADRFVQLLKDFSLRQRRFGKIAEQLETGQPDLTDCEKKPGLPRAPKTLNLANQAGLDEVNRHKSGWTRDNLAVPGDSKVFPHGAPSAFADLTEVN